MKNLLVSVALSLSLLVVLSLAACRAERSQNPAAFDLSQLKSKASPELLKDIGSLSVNKACSTKSDCRTIGVGHMACGGPENYVIYSGKNTDEKVLKAVVDRYNTLRKEEVKKSGMMSICLAKMPPTVDCVSNVCTAVGTNTVQ